MSLRLRIVLIYLLTITALAFAGYIAAHHIVLGSFATLERNIAQQNIERAINALSNDIANLNTLVGDWAGWDDTYIFIADCNERYIQSNLVDETFSLLRLHAMLFVDLSGHLVFGKAFDLNEQQEVPIPESLLVHITADDPLVRHEDPDSSMAGIMLTPEGLLLVASRPILPSNKQGPIRGALIMARYLDSTELQSLATVTILSLSIRRFSDPHLPSDFLAVRPLLSAESPIAVRPLNGRSIAGYALLTDVYGEPGVILRIDMPRDIYQHGQVTVGLFSVAILVVGAIFIATLLLHLDRMILSRLAKLDAAVRKIGASGDLSARVSATGNDELTDLAHGINRMLEDLEQSHIAVKEATTRYQQLFEEVQTGVLVIDAATHTIVDANSAAVRLIGTPKEEIVGRQCSTFCLDHQESCIHKEKGEIIENSEGMLRTASGEHLSVMRAATAVTLNRQPYLLESVVDISERKRYESRLAHLATHDYLTDVANRRTFEDALEHAMADARRGMPVALLFLDVDSFKPINDSLGHDAGDEALIILTRLLKQNLRNGDLLARLGGDEFALLIEGATLPNACRVAERIRQAIEKNPITVKGKTFQLTASIGVVAVDGHSSVRDVMARADAIMYKAKERGGNRVEVG